MQLHAIELPPFSETKSSNAAVSLSPPKFEHLKLHSYFAKAPQLGKASDPTGTRFSKTNFHLSRGTSHVSSAEVSSPGGKKALPVESVSSLQHYYHRQSQGVTVSCDFQKVTGNLWLWRVLDVVGLLLSGI